jgi:alkyl sulfatase BDS1-like metallo-beta-lactamase superfamily hydrolase
MRNWPLVQYRRQRARCYHQVPVNIFEQIGYQQENPGLRNSFLAGAYELRTGIPQGETAGSMCPDVVCAMSTELFLNFLGIRLDSRRRKQ